MRACFLGQNICSLGYGVAILQAPRLEVDEPVRPLSEVEKLAGPDRDAVITKARDAIITKALIGSRPVANPQRPVTSRPDTRRPDTSPDV